MLRSFLLAAILMATSCHASAQKKADFIDGTYVMSDEACGNLKKLAAGTPASITTEPWRVDRSGLHFWEGGCGFSRIDERQKGKVWDVTARCEEGPNKSTERYTFVRTGDGAFDVKLKNEKNARRYTRCEVGRGK